MHGYRSSHLHKGLDYDCLFEQGSYAHLLWQFERGILRDVVSDRFGGKSFNHLDVACGTGRILEHMRQFSTRSVGIDISPSMLKIARTRMPDAELVRGDFASRVPPLSEKFDLITCFRFFLNAEPELRSDVARNVKAFLSDRGVFVFNNHRNYHSLTYRLLRAAGRDASQLACMTHQETADFIAEAGLKIIAMRHVGVVPGTDKRMYLPYCVGETVERAMTRIKAAALLSNDLLYVCQRA
jgi:SAM-dependent methyltransferase